VMVAHERPTGRELYAAVRRRVRSSSVAVGVGGRCDAAGLPRSFQEALRALETRKMSRVPVGATVFDELGIYRLLSAGGGNREIAAYVHEWLGALLDYDAQHSSDLVPTLSQYFECGGNYDATAQALVIHRSTLRYRLQRIREVSGLDLGEVESRLNLHLATRAWRVLQGTT
jgi:DNA-binding PucR family transcriptional regulator